MRLRTVLAALLLAAPALAAAAGGRLVAAFDDPSGDATGPGTYVPPGDSGFQPGDFDLRRFEVFDEGEHVRLEVTLGAPIRRPAVPHRTNQTPAELTSGIYLQNVDVYVDSDPGPGGLERAIPGRRVTLGPARTWERAVVLTPQPGPARAVIEDAMGDAARRVLVPDRIDVRGRTLAVRIPKAELGGTPAEQWGWSVHVSGARWEREFSLLRKAEPDAFTMPVVGVREAWAFGGAPAGEAHPRVVDVLLPKGAGDQEAVLGAFDAGASRLAAVPFVAEAPWPEDPARPVAGAAEPVPGARPAAPNLRPSAPPPAAGFTVADLADDVVSIAGPAAGLQPLQLGRVVDAKGETIARLVVLQVLEHGLVARAVEGRERIKRGATVVFEAAGR